MRPDAQRRTGSQMSGGTRQQKRGGLRVSEEMRALQVADPQEVISHICATLAIVISWLLIICCFPWSLLFVVKVVYEYERVVVLRLGRLVRKQPLTAGLHIIIPCLDSVRKVDMRVRSFSMPLADLITLDSMMIRVDAIVYYRVHDPVLVTTNVEDAEKSTREASMTICRNMIVRRHLNEILADRLDVCGEIQEELSRATAEWGIAIQRVELTDVQLSEELHRALTLEKEARQNARVKLIAAEGEAEIASALTTAATKLASAPMAMQLRYLQTLQSLTTSQKNNISTVLVPLPLEMSKLPQFSFGTGNAATSMDLRGHEIATPSPSQIDRSLSNIGSPMDMRPFVAPRLSAPSKFSASSAGDLTGLPSNTRVYADRPPRP